MRLLVATAGAVLIVLLVAWLMPEPEPLPPPAQPPADYVGSATCAQCHAGIYQDWQQSAHAQTLRRAKDTTVLGEFSAVEPVSFKELTVQPTAWEDLLILKDGQRLAGKIVSESASEVRISVLGKSQTVPREDIASIKPGEQRRREARGRPSAGEAEYKMIVAQSRGAGQAPKTEKFTVDYVLGRGRQTQQYLTRLADGRLQVLPLTWDARKKLWYDQRLTLPNPNDIGPDSPYFWTGFERTANLSCLQCHASQVVPNYAPRAKIYRTTWAEAGVSCEVCHGPAAEHVEVARQAQQSGSRPPDWRIKSLKRLSAQARTELCAQCHSQREAHEAGLKPGENYYDRFVPRVWSDEARYWPDGTPRDQNAQYLSLLQSGSARAAELTCTDCHSPHRNDIAAIRNDTTAIRNGIAAIRAPSRQSDELCTSHHAGIAERLADHSRHLARMTKAGGPSPSCLDCHMPKVEIPMGRLVTDHRITVPDPEATVALGIPNSCNTHHATETPDWTARRFAERYGRDPRGSLARTLTVEGLRRGDSRALEPGLRLLTDPRESPPLRATVATLLAPAAQPRVQQALLETALRAHPLIQIAAVTALSTEWVGAHAGEVARLLRAPLRTVRLAAVSQFIKDPGLIDRLDPADRQALRAVLEEAFAAASARGEHPAAAVELARIDWARGRRSQATRRLRLVLEEQPDYVPARIALAQLYLAQQRFEEALVQFQALARIRPEDLAAQIGIAQSLIPIGRPQEAADILEKVLESTPGAVPALLHLGLAYQALGRTDQAVAQWREVLRLDPNNVVARALLSRTTGEDTP